MSLEFKDLYGLKVSRCGIVIGRRGRPLKPTDNGRGYLIVGCTVDGVKTSKAVHRLVAEAWIPNPNNLPEVNHKDCNKLNCHADNLEWITHGDNIKYSYDTQGRSALGVNNARCKVTVDIVEEICELLSKGDNPATIRDLGYNYSLVRAIKRRKNWTHISNNYAW